MVGHAILGYKTAETYERMIGRRVSGTTSSGRNRFLLPLSTTLPAASGSGRPLVEYEAVGTPSAYFRWVPEDKPSRTSREGGSTSSTWSTGEAVLRPGTSTSSRRRTGDTS